MSSIEEILISLFDRIGPDRQAKVSIIYSSEFNEMVDLTVNVLGNRFGEKHLVDSGILDERTLRLFESDKNKTLILASTRFDLGHNDHRIKAKYEKNKTIITYLHPKAEVLSSYLTIPEEICSDPLLRDLNNGKSWRITTKAGTDLSGMISTTAKRPIFNENGRSGGDFPFGEIGFGPEPGTVNGRIVVDLKVQHLGLLQHPISFSIKKDRIISINGMNSDIIYEIMREYKILELISEVSFGTNHRRVMTDIKESIVEEKNLGTGHFGLGGQGTYGSRRGPHFDVVYDRPTLYLDGRILIKNGIVQVK